MSAFLANPPYIENGGGVRHKKRGKERRRKGGRERKEGEKERERRRGDVVHSTRNRRNVASNAYLCTDDVLYERSEVSYGRIGW